MEQLLTENTLQGRDLCRDGRLRHPQLFRRLPQASFLGDHPEISKMMIVKEFHAWRVLGIT
jgi:hypothetical protein